jgi:hypothetical protein
MRYFELDHNTDPQIVGVTNGTGQLNGSDLYNSSNQWHHNIFRIQPKIDRKFWWKKWVHSKEYAAHPLEGIVLDKKGKLTDYMQFNSKGFYVSEKLKSILEGAHLPPHIFQQTVITSLKTSKPINGYYWFAYDFDMGDHTIDYSRSKFTLEQHEKKYNRKFFVNSYDDYMKVFYETGEALSARKIVFNENFDKDLDIFSVQFLLWHPYISERLLEVWQKEGITGYVARSPESMKNRAERFNKVYEELVFE